MSDKKIISDILKECIIKNNDLTSDQQINLSSWIDAALDIGDHLEDAVKEIQLLTEKNIKLNKKYDEVLKKVEKLERENEQLHKGLTDYQFNYPSIKELSEENNNLQKKINTAKGFLEQCLRIIHAECKPDVKQNPIYKDRLEKAEEFLGGK